MAACGDFEYHTRYRYSWFISLAGVDLPAGWRYPLCYRFSLAGRAGSLHKKDRNHVHLLGYQFIYWGTKRKDTRMGYVADFCPICRNVQTFVLNRVGMAGHLYGVSIGGGKTVGFLRVCETCHATLPADPSQYENAAVKKGEDTASLARSTFPNFAIVNRERLALEERIPERAASLPSGTRLALIKEAFLLTAFHKANAVPMTGTRPALALLAAFVLPIFVAMVTDSIIPGISTITAIATFMICLVYAFWSGVMELMEQGRRAARALLVRALGPLRPTRDELQNVLNDLEVRGSNQWNRCKPDNVLRWLKDNEKRAGASPNATAARPAATDV